MSTLTKIGAGAEVRPIRTNIPEVPVKKSVASIVCCLLSTVAWAADRVDGDTLVRRLKSGEMTLVQFENPADDKESTMVICVPNERRAVSVLDGPVAGGMVLTHGGQIVFKNDRSARFTDGTSLQGRFIQIECD